MVLTISAFNKKVLAHYSLKLDMNQRIYWKRREIKCEYWLKSVIRFMGSYFHLGYLGGLGLG
jgi:hypothetical protein